MANASDYLENKIAALLFGATAYSIPATYYFALFTSAPDDTGGGTEVSGGSYARAAVTNNVTNFPAPTGGVSANGTAISFAQATASWGTVTHFGIFDALTGGNLIVWGALTTPKTVATNDTVSFSAGQLTITVA